MTLTLDEIESGAPERIPGTFKRDKRGTPYVSDPTGAVVKSGKRKGEPKWVRYGRPSGYHHQIEDGYNLNKWDQRNIVLGLAGAFVAQAERPELGQHEFVDRLVALAGGDRDDEQWRADADALIGAAKDAAKAQLAAERGTHTHALTEDDDGGASWLTRAEDGQDLGIGLAAQSALVTVWRKLLADNGLEVLAAECAVVNDEFRVAGTLDRIARLTRDLAFVVDGEIVTLPAGTVVVLDIKTGQMRIDQRDGQILWWHGYAVQCFLYASAHPYDLCTDTRGAWDWPIDQRYALIAHLPAQSAIDGDVTAELVLVDLAKGRAAAELCRAAKAWEQSRDVFGRAHQHAGVVVAPGSPAAAPATSAGADTPEPPADVEPDSGTPPADGASAAPATDPLRGFVAKVVGVTFIDAYPGNLNRIEQRLAGEEVCAGLVRDPANVHDGNAIQVWIDGEGMIGHIAREHSARIAPLLDAGQQWRAKVRRIVRVDDASDKPGIEIHGWRVDTGITKADLAVRLPLLLANEQAARWLRASWPAGLPSVSKAESPEHLAAIDALFLEAEKRFSLPFGDHDKTRDTPPTGKWGLRPAPAAGTWQRPPDGAPLDEPTLAALQRSARGLPDNLKRLVGQWNMDARAAGREIALDGVHTERSFEIVRAMCNAALVHVDVWRYDEEHLRIALAAALGTEMALMPACSIGQAFGSLTIEEARGLAAALDGEYGGSPAVTFDPDGRPVLAA